MKAAKRYIFGFFLIFPFVGGYLPNLQIAGIDLTPERTALLIFGLVLIYLLISNNLKLRVSKVTAWLIIFSLYLLVNYSLQAQFEAKELWNLILPVFLLLYIDNLDFNEADLVTLRKVLSVVAVGTFLASLIQLTIDPYFYMGINNTDEVMSSIEHYEVSDGLFRNNSLYRGIGSNEGPIASGLLCVYFMFLNFRKPKTKYIVLAGLTFFSAFITFSKYVWLMPIIGAGYFMYYRFGKGRYLLFLMVGAVLFLIYFFLWEDIESSTLYRNRVMAKTYLGRTRTTDTFFDQYFWLQPFFGFGVSSWSYDEFVSQDIDELGIHVGIFDVMFRGGIIGITLLGIFLYQYYRRGVEILRRTGNPVFLSFVVIYLMTNLTGVFIEINFYGFYVFFFYLALAYQLTVEKAPDQTSTQLEEKLKLQPS